MKLREYLSAIEELVKNNPEALDMELYYSTDDEGNSYGSVYRTPTLSKFNVYGREVDLICEEDFEDNPEEYKGYVEAITIN